MVGFKISVKRKILILIGLRKQSSIAPYQRIVTKKINRRKDFIRIYEKVS